MSVAPNNSRRVITRKTWALGLVVYSFFLVTADTRRGGEVDQQQPRTFPTTTGTACFAHKCLHYNIYKNKLQGSFSVKDCEYCSKHAACCIRWDDKCFLLDCGSRSTDDACCIKCDDSCRTKVPPPCNKEAPKSTTTLSLSSSLSTPTHKEDGYGNDVHLPACKTTGILGALLAFIVGVIVGLLVAWLRHRKCSSPLQESPANTGMSEMVNTRHDHKDRQEASGNNCEDVHSLAQAPNLPSDVASVLQPETSTVPNDQDSGAGVYCHLRVVSEAETTEYTPMTPPDKKNITAPPTFSQQMMATQHLPNIDEDGYARIADTVTISRPSEPLRHQSATSRQARSPDPLEPRSDDADEYDRLRRHDNQSKALSGDGNYQHLQTIAHRRDNPSSCGYELATVTTDIRSKTKETEAPQSFNIPEGREDNPKSLSCSPSASDDHQEERLKDGLLTAIERHEYFELEPLQEPRDDDEDGSINNDHNDDVHGYSSPNDPDIRLLEQPCTENYHHLQDAHRAEVLVSSDYELAQVVSDNDSVAGSCRSIIM